MVDRIKQTSSNGSRHVWLAPAYVLHQYPYRDTSRIVEAFTSEHGRLTLFARGANGPKSALKGVLRPFQRLLVSWSGKAAALGIFSVFPPRASKRPNGLALIELRRVRR